MPPLKLKDVCELIVDCEHKTAPTQETGYPSIRTPNVGRGRLILEGVNRVSEETYLAWSKRATPKADDIILAREAPLGNAAIIREGLEVCLGQRTVLIRPDKSKVNPRYLVYLLLGDEIQGKFRAYGAGATVPHLNMSDIRNVDLPALPLRKMQDKIAAILSAYDDLIENNQSRIKLLEQATRDLYQEWFVRFRFPSHEQIEMVERDIGQIPNGWQLGKMNDFLELKYGKGLISSSRIEGEVPVYGSSGIVGFHNESLVDAPGIIVGRKGNVGSVFWSQVPFFPIDTVFYVSTEIEPLYVYCNLRERKFLNSDAAVPGLNRDYAHSLPFLLPPTDLLQKFSNIAAPMFSSIYLLEQRNKKLEMTRDLLLPRLISGELDISSFNIPVAQSEVEEAEHV